MIDGAQALVCIIFSLLLFIVYVVLMSQYLPSLADANVSGPLMSIGAATFTMGLFVFFGFMYILSSNPDAVATWTLFVSTAVNLPLALFGFAAAISCNGRLYHSTCLIKIYSKSIIRHIDFDTMIN